MSNSSRSSTKNSKVSNETGHRKGGDRREKSIPVSVDRRKGARRRNIDPTTCERDYSDAEIEFMTAMDDYKRSSGRMFPTCSEILEVFLKLGYRKLDSHSPLAISDFDLTAGLLSPTEAHAE
ncbi:MAG: hypothetical protein KF851_05070 [Pirellulaceae bacterium]|nr:hypothetical protein [Pirellulaceae bacterium]